MCSVSTERKSLSFSPINQSIFLLTYLIWNLMLLRWMGKKKPRLPLNIHMAAVIMYSPSSHWTSFCKGLGLPVPTTKSSSLSLSLSIAVHTTYLRVLGQWTKKVHNSKQSFKWVARHVRIQVNTKLSAFSSPFLTTQYLTIKKQEKSIKTFTTQSPIIVFFFHFLWYWNFGEI